MKVYTAIFDAYDRLRSPTVINHAWDYICICNPLIPAPAPWRAEVKPVIITPRRSARYYKILSHRTFPSTDITVWHGGNVQLRADPDRLLDIMKSDIAVIRHSERTSVYNEAEVCEQWGKSHSHVIRAQMGRYKALGFPGTPLSAAFLIIRRNTGRIRELNELWWNEIESGSIRDQLSFDYACWRLGIEPAIIPGDIFRGPHFVRYLEHEK